MGLSGTVPNKFKSKQQERDHSVVIMNLSENPLWSYSRIHSRASSIQHPLAQIDNFLTAPTILSYHTFVVDTQLFTFKTASLF